MLRYVPDLSIESSEEYLEKMVKIVLATFNDPQEKAAQNDFSFFVKGMLVFMKSRATAWTYFSTASCGILISQRDSWSYANNSC